MLAAAFALGDTEVVDRVVRSFEKQKLGIALTKFTKKSIRHIISVFKTYQDVDIDHFNLALFISAGICSADFRNGTPKLVYLQENKYSMKQLRKWGEIFGFHVLPESLLRNKPTRRTLKRGVLKFEFDEDPPHHRNDTEGKIILSNFRCAFQSPIDIEALREGKVVTKFASIHLTVHKSLHNIRKPDIDAIAETFAKKIAAGITRHAAIRLENMLLSTVGWNGGISHEHISVQSGNSSEFLQMIREHDMNMIRTHSDKISQTLQSTLRNSVPLPDKATANERRGTPSAQRDYEVALFCESYTKLVNLSYCEVPLVAGKPPSSFVPEYTGKQQCHETFELLSWYYSCLSCF